MGLYDGGKKINFNFKFDFDWKKFKVPLMGLGAAIVFLAFVLIVFLAVQPKPLEAGLSPNPLDLTTDLDSFLTITVNNVTDSTASNVVVSVETEASDSITIFPKSRTIPTLGKGETRTLSPFAVSPNPSSEIFTGTYILTIRTVINGQLFEKQVLLDLKAV